jgi:hypothetical protein
MPTPKSQIDIVIFSIFGKHWANTYPDISDFEWSNILLKTSVSDMCIGSKFLLIRSVF